MLSEIQFDSSLSRFPEIELHAQFSGSFVELSKYGNEIFVVRTAGGLLISSVSLIEKCRDDSRIARLIAFVAENFRTPGVFARLYL
jgi:hypothetical protein